MPALPGGPGGLAPDADIADNELEQRLGCIPPDWHVVAGLVADAYRLVAPPRLVAQLDARQGKLKRGWRADWLDRNEAESDS